ncbi:MAG: twin-arginine translocase subunit TatB [Caldilineaceae bacterium]|nr:twin-arginine translocase subunit TatB [Caldilineaceae bacterium]MCB9156684.1 twin-arginine translocase subunit TatB [Caldilineaceae bacterium]
MNSIFGIGLPELFFIAIIALIVLGPERLPGAIREVAKFLKQVRALGNELTSQFSEELAFLDEMNPRRILEEATRPDAEEKPAAKSAPKPKTTANKTSPKTGSSGTTKPATPKPATSTTAKTTTPQTTAAAAAAANTASTMANPESTADAVQDAVADEVNTLESEAAEVNAGEAQPDQTPNAQGQSTAAAASTGGAGAAQPITVPPQNAGADSPNGQVETENSIAPPELMNAIERDAGPNGNTSTAKALSAPATSSPAAASSQSTNGADSADVESTNVDAASSASVEPDTVSSDTVSNDTVSNDTVSNDVATNDAVTAEKQA